MKRKVLFGALLWTLLISVVHVTLNIGWGRLVDEVQVMRGAKRQELIVGFLPVT